MTTLREAAQQALEALNHVNVQDRVEIINNLRAALAEQVQEPVACMDMLRRARNLLSHPPIWSSENAASRHRLSEEIDAFITALPQRKPLTEEEIRDLWSWAMTAEAERTATTQQHAFARAIEAKHGIGVDE